MNVFYKVMLIKFLNLKIITDKAWLTNWHIFDRGSLATTYFHQYFLSFVYPATVHLKPFLTTSHFYFCKIVCISSKYKKNTQLKETLCAENKNYLIQNNMYRGYAYNKR